MQGYFTDLFVLTTLKKVSNGRGGWTYRKESDPKAKIWGLVLPTTITEVITDKNTEAQYYELKALIWQLDSELIDTDTLVQFQNKTFRVIQIDNTNRLSNKVTITLRGEKGDETSFYT